MRTLPSGKQVLYILADIIFQSTPCPIVFSCLFPFLLYVMIASSSVFVLFVSYFELFVFDTFSTFICHGVAVVFPIFNTSIILHRQFADRETIHVFDSSVIFPVTCIVLRFLLFGLNIMEWGLRSKKLIE